MLAADLIRKRILCDVWSLSQQPTWRQILRLWFDALLDVHKRSLKSYLLLLEWFEIVGAHDGTYEHFYGSQSSSQTCSPVDYARLNVMSMTLMCSKTLTVVQRHTASLKKHNLVQEHGTLESMYYSIRQEECETRRLVQTGTAILEFSSTGAKCMELGK